MYQRLSHHAVQRARNRSDRIWAKMRKRPVHAARRTASQPFGTRTNLPRSEGGRVILAVHRFGGGSSGPRTETNPESESRESQPFSTRFGDICAIIFTPENADAAENEPDIA